MIFPGTARMRATKFAQNTCTMLLAVFPCASLVLVHVKGTRLSITKASQMSAVTHAHWRCSSSHGSQARPRQRLEPRNCYVPKIEFVTVLKLEIESLEKESTDPTHCCRHCIACASRNPKNLKYFFQFIFLSTFT